MKPSSLPQKNVITFSKLNKWVSVVDFTHYSQVPLGDEYANPLYLEGRVRIDYLINQPEVNEQER